MENPLGMYFLQRDVLGSIPSAEYLIQMIDSMHRPIITGLIERGMGKRITEFDPERYKLYLFTFDYWHPKVVQGFKEMDKLIKEMTDEK